MKDILRTATTSAEESHATAATSWCDLGRDSMAAGDISEALWHLRQAVENDSDHVAAWQLLGRCFEQMGEEARAQRCFRLAFRLSMKTPSAPVVVPRREPRDA